MLNFFREELSDLYMIFMNPCLIEIEIERSSQKDKIYFLLRNYLIIFIFFGVLVFLGSMFGVLFDYVFDWESSCYFFVFVMFVGLSFSLVGWVFNRVFIGLFAGILIVIAGGVVPSLFIGFSLGSPLTALGVEVFVLLSIKLISSFFVFNITILDRLYFGFFGGVFFGTLFDFVFWNFNDIFLGSNGVSLLLLMYFPLFLILYFLPFDDESLKWSRPNKSTEWQISIKMMAKDFQEILFVDELSIIKYKLMLFPIYGNKSIDGWGDARQQLYAFSDLAEDYKARQTYTGQLNVLAELYTKMTAFHSAMKLTAAPVGTTFEPLAAKWLRMIEDEQEKLRQQSTHNELPNPYIAGNPLDVRDQQLFLGRDDILLAIEQFILNADQRPSLLLYGRRRTGKSSTLKNLPHSRFEPVYIDCQDAKWHESDQAFCYNLAHTLFSVLFKSDSLRGLRQPQIEQFDKNAFTQLDQFLTQAQGIADQRGKRILLAFDEYEELENSIINGDISEKVLGKLRNLIQHSKSIVVLVSGSHRFEELTRLNWANYLINTRTLELSYLDAESARELLTKPVPELHYEAGVVDDIIRITHCQPYLLQAVASELVNYLNSKQQTTATPDDLNTALEKTLVSASAYFSDTWRKDNSATEQQVMRALATGKTESVLADAAYLPAIQSLIRKEIVEGTEGSCRLAVELFACWIVKNQV